MNNAPINVKLKTPTSSTWAAQSQAWRDLNQEVGGNAGFYPLTVKAGYVIGVLHDISTAVSTLLHGRLGREAGYLPAYGVFASGIELLGRCVNGNPAVSGNVADLRTGFKWLVASDVANVPDTQIVIQTTSRQYTVEDLTALRHFAAHGQAASGLNLQSIDFGILEPMPPKLVDGLERYWNELQKSDVLCEKLAEANIIALRGWPVFKSWALFQGSSTTGPRTITQVFSGFNWQV